MSSRNKSNDEHEVTVNLSIVQAVESCRKEPRYYETTRNGRRKRVYESVKPLHNFHIEYQLMPGSLSPVYHTDIVTYSVVAKVFTGQDERVVNIWKENGLTYYGWKHSHQLKLSLKSLLELHNHTLIVRLWNTSDKLSPKARFDRPKAFRLPAPNSKHSAINETDSNGLIAGGIKPAQLPNIFQDVIPTKRSRRASRRSSQAIESVNEGTDMMDISPRKTFNISMVIEETGDEQDVPIKEDLLEAAVREESKDTLSVSAPESSLRTIKKDMTASQVLSIENLSSSTSRVKGITRRRLRHIQAEAEETLRIEKEGMIVLSMKFADLFGSRNTINAKIEESVRNVKDLQVSLSLDSPLMSDKQRRLLNPMEFTIEQATNLPPIYNMCKPAYVKYQFYDKPIVQTPAIQLLTDQLYWNHTIILLLGTIESELLLEYLRGPPLVIEVHDRDQIPTEEVMKGALFGTIKSDPLIGTYAYSKEVQKKSQSGMNLYGVVNLDLSTFLDGIMTMEYTLPILNKSEQDYSKRSCDYTKQDSQLRIKIKLSCPLNNFPSAVTAGTIQPVSLRPLTPFGRIVYVLSDTTQDYLINQLLSIIKNINLTALKLNTLPEDTQMIALSTYKLTREEMYSIDCNVITGCHIEDGEKHFVICEGIAHNGIRHIWDNMPHHSSQDPAVINVFYNSDYTFSSRLYGNLDVDLTHIKLPRPLSSIIQQTSIYIHKNIPKLCYNCLMKINELQLSPGFSDIIRTNSLPTPLMITALSLYCMQLEDTITVNDSIVMKKEESDKHNEEETAKKGTGLIKRRRRQLSWEPLGIINKRYELILRERDNEPEKDYIKENIVSSKLISDNTVQLRNIKSKTVNKPHVRSYSESDSKGIVHLYSSQTYNSSVAGKEMLRRQLDPNKRYTYSQLYHSRTIEPPPSPLIEEVTVDTGKKQKFKYPASRSNLESNALSKKPHSSRIEEVQEPFIDNCLHANKLEPTVNWTQYKWDERERDFERYRPCPLDFGIKQPVTIHLAGNTRLNELKQYEQKQWSRWINKVVVDDIQFHHVSRVVGPEYINDGIRADSTQTDKLQGLLKDEPKKLSYRLSERLRVDNIPSLGVINHGINESNHTVGFLPGPYTFNSLKKDSNTVPLYKPFQPPEHLHSKDFVLYYRQQLSALSHN